MKNKFSHDDSLATTVIFFIGRVLAFLWYHMRHALTEGFMKRKTRWIKFGASKLCKTLTFLTSWMWLTDAGGAFCS